MNVWAFPMLFNLVIKKISTKKKAYYIYIELFMLINIRNKVVNDK